MWCADHGPSLRLLDSLSENFSEINLKIGQLFTGFYSSTAYLRKLQRKFTKNPPKEVSGKDLVQQKLFLVVCQWWKQKSMLPIEIPMKVYDANYVKDNFTSEKSISKSQPNCDQFVRSIFILRKESLVESKIRAFTQ